MQLTCHKMIIVSRPCWPLLKLPKNVKVIHNGIIIDKEYKYNDKKLLGRTINIGFIGRIHPAKGLHVLIDWIVTARSRGLDLHLIVRGSFSVDAPTYEDQIKERIKTNNAQDFILLEGHIKDQDKIYSNIDIVCVPSIVPDPLPRSVMEAMARGIVVFGYPAGGIPEMIDHKKNGFLISNAEDFYSEIIKLIKDSEIYKDISKNSILTIADNFSLDTLFKSLNEIY